MKSAIYGIAFILATFGAFSMAAIHHTVKTSAKTVAVLHDPDGITGDWDGTVEAMGTKVAFKINLKLDDEKVTGTVESGHTGAGTIKDGVWKNNKLSFTADFAKHESISFKGELKDGKITGEYSTEGRTEKWGAVKKVKSESSANSTNKMTSNTFSGDWGAFFVAQDTSAPVTLSLKLDGDKVSGTFSSEHLGTGAIEDVSWADNKLSFTIKVPQATIKVWGVLKDGKFTGDFDAGQMKGKWDAKKK